jgi:hypothetical protein
LRQQPVGDIAKIRDIFLYLNADTQEGCARYG